MNHYIHSFCFLLLFLVNSCTNDSIKNSNQPSEEATKQQLNKLLDNWHQAAADAEFETYFDLMAENSIFIGTDASENWSKTEFITFSKPFFDAGKAWAFKATERAIYFNDRKDVAWFDELLDTWMGTCRGSGVIENENGAWKIKHYVLSVTIPNELMDEFISLQKD